MTLVHSNHSSLVYRRALKYGLPKAYLKHYNEFLGVGKGWIWVDDHTITLSDNSRCFFTHGLSADVLKVAQQYGMNTVQGHYHTKDTKSFFTKRVLDTFLQKQSVEDSINIRNSTTNNLLERSRLALEANTDRLKKSIVYGKTDLEISNATNELNIVLESDAYNRIYGKKAADEKNKVREDIDYYKGLRTLDRDPMKINDVIANSNLPIEKIEKLRSHAKLSAIKIDETTGNNLKDYDDQLNKGNDPGINSILALRERAVAVDNFEAAKKIEGLIEKRNIIVGIRSKSLPEMDAEISKMESAFTTARANNQDILQWHVWYNYLCHQILVILYHLNYLQAN